MEEWTSRIKHVKSDEERQGLRPVVSYKETVWVHDAMRKWQAQNKATLHSCIDKEINCAASSSNLHALGVALPKPFHAISSSQPMLLVQLLSPTHAAGRQLLS